MNVNIIDIGSGNIRSIKNWIEKTNIKCNSVSRASELNANVVILPGVGSAGSYMSRLKNRRFDDAILKHLNQGGRLIGICLGFQIMAKFSEEDNGVCCLGLIDAEVKKLSAEKSHNGWEELSFRKDKMNNQVFNSEQNLTRKRILNGRVFYNHEYGFLNNDNDAFSLPVSQKHEEFSGMFVKDKIIGLQFHPEKSQLTGVDLINMIL